jgi:hypothetical protein
VPARPTQRLPRWTSWVSSSSGQGPPQIRTRRLPVGRKNLIRRAECRARRTGGVGATATACAQCSRTVATVMPASSAVAPQVPLVARRLNGLSALHATIIERVAPPRKHRRQRDQE